MPTKRIADVLNYGAICLTGYFDEKPKTIITFGSFGTFGQLTMCGDSLLVGARTGFVWVGPELLGLISGVRTLSVAVDHRCPPLSQAP